MYALLVLLLISSPSLGINLELTVETGDGSILLLNGFLSHEYFYTALSNQIGFKVRNATQTILVHSKQNFDGLLAQIDYMEYTFLQIFHSLATGDITFTNQLIELYFTFGQLLRLSDYFKSHVAFLPEPTYGALYSIVNLNRNRLKPVPEEIINGILSVANKSSVFVEASRRANAGVIKWLQNYVSETERFSALETACNQRNFDIVKILIKSNITFVKPCMSVISCRNSKGESVLHLAAESKNPEFVVGLIECGAEVNIFDDSGSTPLFRAVKNNDILTAKILIEKKSDVNAATKSGNIPLHEAARNGNYEMFYLILSSGSSPNKETDEGLTPLLISQKCVFREVVEYLFWGKLIKLKELHNDLRFLYLLTSYEGTDRTTRRGKINLDRILEHSMIAKELLLRGEKTYIPNDMKLKLLYLVMKLRITTLAQSMLNIGTRLDPEQFEAKQIFKNAILTDNHELIALMLNEGMSENTEFGVISALQLAADHGSVTIFNLLLKKRANMNVSFSGSLLHAASEGGKEAIVRYLLNNGSKVDSLDRSRQTPLYYAAFYGHPEIVKLLIDNKANPNARDKDMDTPLHFATYSNDEKSIKILIQNGAEIEARNKYGETPLFFAAKEGSAGSIAYLINAGAVIDAKDSANRTPLEVSIVGGYINSTRVLLDNGMNPNIINTQSRTSLQLAVTNGKVELVQLLLQSGVLVNTPDSNGRNALHEAVAKNSSSIVQLLVNSGISVNAKDKDGRTPLDVAITNCSRGIVSFLVKKGAKATIQADPNCILGD